MSDITGDATAYQYAAALHGRRDRTRFINTIGMGILAVIACLLWVSIAFQQGKLAAADLCLKDLAACAKIAGKPMKILTFKNVRGDAVAPWPR
jgi:hypothetical protein